MGFEHTISAGERPQTYALDNAATCYGLEGPGIEFRGKARFFTIFQTSPGAHPAGYTVGTGTFPGVKRPGRGVDDPPRLVTKLKTE
jgi:hypothetical protein